MIFIGFRIKPFSSSYLKFIGKGKQYIVLGKQPNIKNYNDSRIMK